MAGSPGRRRQSRATADPRAIALQALQQVDRQGAYTDIALDRALRQAPPDLNPADRALASELVYGIVRRQRTLDALIDRLGKKSARQQPPDLRLLLHLGLYQLRHSDRIPARAAVHSTVELAKRSGPKFYAGALNGILRSYLRAVETGEDPLPLPNDAIARLGVEHSFPDWIVSLWDRQFGRAIATELCTWFNQAPSLDLRVNPLQTNLDTLQAALGDRDITATPLPHLPQTLRLTSGKIGPISKLPGFDAGWWSVQDGSAQLVVHLLAPQPGETIIDACAAPGGKATHIAELMGDRGTIWACDRDAKRLQKVTENAKRLQLTSIRTLAGDSRDREQFIESADRVLVDAPCSGLGTLHKRPDLRWRQTPDNIAEIITLQRTLLAQTAAWVKPGGILVYAT
ncbi:MAG: 16S rRNA (cytosine(967)-C(5))-methyltransferase, partial [Cyanobacteria bacterium J06641_5]